MAMNHSMHWLATHMSSRSNCSCSSPVVTTAVSTGRLREIGRKGRAVQTTDARTGKGAQAEAEAKASTRTGREAGTAGFASITLELGGQE